MKNIVHLPAHNWPNLIKNLVDSKAKNRQLIGVIIQPIRQHNVNILQQDLVYKLSGDSR